MLRDDDFIDKVKCFEYFLPFVLAHEDVPLLLHKPVIIIENDDKVIAKGPRFFKQANMANMNRVESTTCRNNHKFGNELKMRVIPGCWRQAKWCKLSTMTKYCPLCENEYQDSLSICPDDNEKLFNAPSVHIDRALSEDVYAASNEIEAECIVAFLFDAGISSQIFRPQVSALPNLSDGRYVITVGKSDKENAVQHIRQARVDGAITNDGVFL